MMRVMETMMQDPSTQQLLLSRLPPHMRRPEVMKAMLSNPEVRQRIAALAEQTGLHKMMGALGADRLAASLDATRQAGIEPGSLFARFMASPALAHKLKDPRVLAALMDVVSNGPKALEKYSGDRLVVEAWNEASAILEQVQAGAPAPGGGGGSGGAPSGGTTGPAAPPGPGGASPEALAAALAARPELAARFGDPEVAAALAEVAAKPWKVVKYLMNGKVMGALKELRTLLKDAHAK